tara:strand:+ start:2168 stop:2515 length:348 start_codon:yes stop_codon:yes gene_type:complete
MGIFSSKDESCVVTPKNILDEKILVSVTESIPNKGVSEFIGPVFAEKVFMPTMRKTEEHFTKIREEVQYLAMEKALEKGANAILGFRVSFAPYQAQGSSWGVSMVVASGNAVVVK